MVDYDWVVTNCSLSIISHPSHASPNEAPDIMQHRMALPMQSYPNTTYITGRYGYACLGHIHMGLTSRNQTGVHERTLHDRVIESTNNDESFEIIDEAVG